MTDQRHGVVVSPEFDQAADHVQPVRELVLLSAQTLGQSADVVEFPRQTLQLGTVADGDDGPYRTSTDLHRHVVDEQDPTVEHDHLVASPGPTRQHVEHPSGRQEGRQHPTGRRAVQAEQALRLIVDQPEATDVVQGDGALTNAVQHRLALLEQRGDLPGLEPERLPFHPPRQEQHSARPQQQTQQRRQQDRREPGPEFRADPLFQDTDRHQPDHVTGPAAHRHLGSHRGSERARLLPDESLPGQHS